MNLLVTGATGFIGRYVTVAALRQGFKIRAVVRSPEAAVLPWLNHPHVEVVTLDLQQTDALQSALVGIDAVLHLAAVMSGSFEDQWQGTVLGTRSLISALTAVPVSHVIAISSFAVYDYLNLSPGTLITESTPLEANPKQRDGYTQTKLAQEILMRQFAVETQTPLTILRPGLVYGCDRLWNAYLGVNVRDRLWVCIGDRAILPLLYVEHCADAIVQALLSVPMRAQTLNLVDDALPTQVQYCTALQQQYPNLPPRISIPWVWLDYPSRGLASLPMAHRLPLPGILRPARSHARFKPFTYSNTRAKQILNWTPRFSLSEALARAGSADVLALTEGGEVVR